jgi:CBS domain containing-hemolysin-like protein
LATAFFVAGEFALVAADRNKVEELARDGHRGARGILLGLKTLSFQLSGAQLGITVTSLLVGFIVEPTIGQALEPLVAEVGFPGGSSLGVAVTLSLFFATAVQMVLGELIPKNLAVARPLGTGMVVVPPLRFLNAALRPVIVFLNSTANTTVRLFGIEPKEEMTGVRSLDELALMIRSSHQEGVLPAEEASLLARSISFREKVAADALVPRVSIRALNGETSLADMVRAALESGHSRFPVIGRDLDDIVGLAHIKDTYRFPPEERDAQVVASIMQEPLLVPESRPLPVLLSEMRGAHKHLAVVLDEYGGTAGIVTIEDLLEEIVGEIEDEYDPSGEGPSLTSQPSGVHVVSGMLHLDEVRETTGLEIPEGDYETLAGFLLTQFNRIPEQGDHVCHGSWELKVVEMDKHRIAKVLIVGLPERDEEEEPR